MLIPGAVTAEKDQHSNGVELSNPESGLSAVLTFCIFFSAIKRVHPHNELKNKDETLIKYQYELLLCSYSFKTLSE